jgi:hypothetical protein
LGRRPHGLIGDVSFGNGTHGRSSPPPWVYMDALGALRDLDSALGALDALGVNGCHWVYGTWLVGHAWGCMGRPHGTWSLMPITTHAATVQEGAAEIEDPADYEAIASTAPFLTELSLKLPASATALPQQMASLLSACSKLEDLALHAYDGAVPAYMQRALSLVDVDALMAAGPQLLHLRLPWCFSLTDLAPLRGLLNLQSLDIKLCGVSDLAPLGALLSQRSSVV